MAKKSNSELFSSLLYLILGALLVLKPGESLNLVMTVAGVVFAVVGVLDLIRGNTVGGLISLIIGLVILVLGWTIADLVLLVLGILLAVKGVVALIDVLGKKRKTVMQVVFPILTVALGLLLAFGDALKLGTVVVGVLLMVDGVIGLIGSLKK